MSTPDLTRRVLNEVARERERQDKKWGEQNHPDGTGNYDGNMETRRMRAAFAKARTQRNAGLGTKTWKHILNEEVAEALAEDDPSALRAELLQAAAVVVAWIEAIDRRGTTR